MAVISVKLTDKETMEQPEALLKQVRELLAPVGGADFYFGEGGAVFLLDLSLPADKGSGVNFDLRLAYALARAAGAGQSGRRVRFVFRPETGFSAQQVLEASGYDNLQAVPGVELIDLSSASTVSRATDTGLARDRVELPQVLADAGLIVSLAKLKTAEGVMFGSAVSQMAAASPDAAGPDAESRDRALVDVYSILAPDLTVVDGWRGDAGFQSQRGDFLLAAVDAVAADAVLAALSGLDLEAVGYLQLAAQYGLGEGEPGGIRIAGDDISSLV